MFEAILFDLDGTLLDIDMDFFLPKYFGEMERMARSSGYQDSKRLINQVLLSTDVMLSDLNPETLNEDSFMQHFISQLEADEMEMREFFDQFYLKGFPRLQEFCRPLTGVPQMMEDVFKRGLKVVIATNSVFPLRAIQSRLDWAGVGDFPYELVTSYEKMHYCKPHLEYYKEIVQFLGVEPSKCLMVGNDVGEDLVAGKLGIKTFLVEDRLIKRTEYPCDPNWRGSLQELFSFIKKM